MPRKPLHQIPATMTTTLDLCKGTGCPLRKKCARYAKAKAFYVHPQYIEGDCLLFIPINTHHTAQKHQGPSCNL